MSTNTPEITIRFLAANEVIVINKRMCECVYISIKKCMSMKSQDVCCLCDRNILQTHAVHLMPTSLLINMFLKQTILKNVRKSYIDLIMF